MSCFFDFSCRLAATSQIWTPTRPQTAWSSADDISAGMGATLVPEPDGGGAKDDMDCLCACACC